MWDYDKLFVEGNIVGLKNLHNNKIYNHGIPNKDCWGDTNEVDWYCFENNNLKRNMLEIQYIIRLDEHGNVVEKLFDRERDMKPEPEPMPELETGMFVLVDTWDGAKLGFVDADNNHVIYQEGGYDFINDDDINGYGIASKIVEVYSKDTCAFDFCTKDDLIWRKPESN